MNEALRAPVYTCLFHYFAKDGSKTPKKSPFRSQLTNIEHFSHHFQNIGMSSCWKSHWHMHWWPGNGVATASKPTLGQWNRSSTCIYWTISAKCWPRDIAWFVSWNGLEPPQYSLLLYLSLPLHPQSSRVTRILPVSCWAGLSNHIPIGFGASTDGRWKGKWGIFALQPTLPRGFWQISLLIWQSLVCPWLNLRSSLTSAVTIQGVETNARRDRKWGKRSQGLCSESHSPLFTK